MQHHNPDILAMLEVLKTNIENRTITGYLAGGDIIFQHHLKDLAHLCFASRFYHYKPKDSTTVSGILNKIGIAFRDRDKEGMYFKTTLDHVNGRLEFYGLEPITMSSEKDLARSSSESRKKDYGNQGCRYNNGACFRYCDDILITTLFHGYSN